MKMILSLVPESLSRKSVGRLHEGIAFLGERVEVQQRHRIGFLNAAAVRRLSQAIALAPLFRPEGVVVHGGYFGWLFDFHPEDWLESAKRSFGELAETAEKAGTRLFVENVFDEDPEHLLRLREAVGQPAAVAEKLVHHAP